MCVCIHTHTDALPRYLVCYPAAVTGITRTRGSMKRPFVSATMRRTVAPPTPCIIAPTRRTVAFASRFFPPFFVLLFFFAVAPCLHASSFTLPLCAAKEKTVVEAEVRATIFFRKTPVSSYVAKYVMSCDCSIKTQVEMQIC